MIKIPATQAGLPAISAALTAGVNVNVTLIFARRRYGEVMEAYLQGLEQRLQAGFPLAGLASVASFFVSRVDTNVDARLQKIIQSGGAAAAQKATALLGKAAIANARLAYADFKRVFASKRFQALQAQGAALQRPLWASTSTKNPAYRDVMYVEELVGPHTVNTMPPQTLVAFLEHGQVRPSLEEDLEAAEQVFADLQALGIAMEAVTAELEREGVQAFADAFSVLLQAVEQRMR
jgi:transaldolase